MFLPTGSAPSERQATTVRGMCLKPTGQTSYHARANPCTPGYNVVVKVAQEFLNGEAITMLQYLADGHHKKLAG